jgi:subtilisin family serine protease
VYVDNATGGRNPSNGDHEAYIRLSGTTSGDRWRITVTDAGGGGRYDAWLIDDSARILNGDSDMTIDEPGNARGVITVGAYNTKAAWPSLSGGQTFPGYVYGQITDFSSRGPTRDGRRKPEVCAPGAWVIAALSTGATSLLSYTHVDGVHAAEQGTSMAAPHVSGSIALLLSLDPTLEVAEVRDLLTSTASADAFTGTVPNETWGWGKLDAKAAVDAATAASPPVEPPEEADRPTIAVRENPVSDGAVFELGLLEGTHAATLRVYTISGRLAYETDVEPTQTTLRWDLRSLSGQPLASGLYVYLVVTDRGSSPLGKLVIVR